VRWAGQAESERERRAKIINAEGEFQASGKTGAGGGDDFRATDRLSTALLTDEEGNFERALHRHHSAGVLKIAVNDPDRSGS
jgi:regulator of protease activity HflC (stomatin/prohibitin superfamily)